MSRTPLPTAVLTIAGRQVVASRYTVYPIISYGYEVKLDGVEGWPVPAGSVGALRLVLGLYRRWQFPYDRFIEYGPEDEWWARPAGFGHEVIAEQHLTLPHAVCRESGLGTCTLVGCGRYHP